mgnify:CR=1 FL=1
MTNNEKKWIFLIIGIMIIVLIVVLLVKVIGGNGENVDQNNMAGNNQVQNEEKYVETLEDGTKLNVSEELNKDRTYNGLEISNIQYTEKDGFTVLLADIKNPLSTKHERELVKISIIGENGEVITDTEAIIGEIEPGGTYQINAAIATDVSNAKDIKIEAK